MLPSQNSGGTEKTRQGQRRGWVTATTSPLVARNTARNVTVTQMSVSFKSDEEIDPAQIISWLIGLGNALSRRAWQNIRFKQLCPMTLTEAFSLSYGFAVFINHGDMVTHTLTP